MERGALLVVLPSRAGKSRTMKMIYWRGWHPSDWRLAHNPVQPACVDQRHGENGFRAFWVPPGERKWVRCLCGWRPDLGAHYHHRDGRHVPIADLPRRAVEEYLAEWRPQHLKRRAG
jgi:hypothetical protein